MGQHNANAQTPRKNTHSSDLMAMDVVVFDQAGAARHQIHAAAGPMNVIAEKADFGPGLDAHSRERVALNRARAEASAWAQDGPASRAYLNVAVADFELPTHDMHGVS